MVGADPDDPSSLPPVDGHGIVGLHHHPSLWRVRQLPEVHRVFSDLYETEQLWVSMDRVSYKAPASERELRVSGVHWDVDPRNFRSMGVQGLVYLTDTESDQGAFACVPSIYRRLPEWVAEQGDDAVKVRRPDVAPGDIERVGGPAGSLLVWHRLMPHTSARNDTPRPRFVQYVTMSPTGGESAREGRLRDFRERRPPEWATRQYRGSSPPQSAEPIDLSPLGRKLVGLDDW